MAENTFQKASITAEAAQRIIAAAEVGSTSFRGKLKKAC